MKLSSALQLSLVISLALGTGFGASAANGGDSTGATSTGSSVIITPELQNADARVDQASKQLDLAKKQLKAAQSILKAAEADLKASKAERQAIALRTQAQGMAQDAGMSPIGNRALAEVDSAAVTAGRNGTPVISPAAAPANVAPSTTNSGFTTSPAAIRTQEMPFTADPATAGTAPNMVAPELR